MKPKRWFFYWVSEWMLVGDLWHVCQAWLYLWFYSPHFLPHRCTDRDKTEIKFYFTIELFHPKAHLPPLCRKSSSKMWVSPGEANEIFTPLLFPIYMPIAENLIHGAIQSQECLQFSALTQWELLWTLRSARERCWITNCSFFFFSASSLNKRDVCGRSQQALKVG